MAIRAAGLVQSNTAPLHTTIRFENRYRAQDGSWHWLEWSSRSDGKFIYATARDVTQQKRLEAEREELMTSVRQLADTDHLTGLANRRSAASALTMRSDAPARLGRP